MNNVVTLPASASAFPVAQLRLIKETVAKDCNTDEFDLFVTVARNAGLDPFRKQISAIVFSQERSQEAEDVDHHHDRRPSRTIAARSGRYRPDENEPEIEYDPALKVTH